MLEVVSRRAVLAAVLSIGATEAAFFATGYGRTEGQRKAEIALPSGQESAVVVAELFTSEGCSSCPPADALLQRLAHEELVPGVRVLTLGEHVDYWDRLGWRDPFSSASFSNRQSEYETRVFHTGSVYTPQLVIDGRLQQVGSDLNAIRRAISQAARERKANVSVTARMSEADQFRVEVKVSSAQPAVRDTADVIIAVTEDQLASDVTRGENRGRVLKHGSVVRSLTALGPLTNRDVFSEATSIPIAPAWVTRNINIVAFVQERNSRRIVGAGSATVNGTPVHS